MNDLGVKPEATRETGAQIKAETAQVVFETIDDNSAGQRLDNYLLKRLKGVPKSHVYKVVRDGQVRINKGRTDCAYHLQIGDVVRIPPVRVSQKTEQTQALPPKYALDLPILFEDEYLLAIDKPAGVAVHGGSGVSFGVIETLRGQRPEAKFLELVHRLDRDTSGVLLLAKKRQALVALHEQVRQGAWGKQYLALVNGAWPVQLKQVKLPLHKYLLPNGERRVKVQSDGLASHTIFKVQQHYAEFTLVQCILKTGRTHQIRVHSAANGHPIAGDDKYGDFARNKYIQQLGLKRMFLHAEELRLLHPITGVGLKFKAPLPLECSQFLNSLNHARAE